MGANSLASIVIPVHNHAGLTRICLEALFAHEPEDIEVIVVDDGSRDHTPDLLAAYGDALKVVRHEQPQSFAMACNTGAAVATGELIVYLNNDTVPAEGWLAAIRALVAERPRAGVVGVRLLYPNNTIQHAGVVVQRDHMPTHVYAGFPAEHPAVTYSREFQVVTGACLALTRKAYEATHGFDPGFVNGYEDVDLCLRARAAGFEVHYCADSVVYHLTSATRGDDWAPMHENARLLRDRWGEDLEPDDLDTYLADGLVSMRYRGVDRLAIDVDPLLAETARGPHDTRLEQALTERSRHVLELMRENMRLLSEMAEEPRAEIVARNDNGGITATVSPESAKKTVLRMFNMVNLLDGKLRPLKVARTDVSTGPPRVNILVPEIDERYIFGGYIAKFQLAARLIKSGRRVRLICVDVSNPGDAQDVRAMFDREFGIPVGAQTLEIFDAADRVRELVLEPEDRLIATTWWTAHLAHQACGAVGLARFLYLIQEYEAFTFSMGSFAAMADASYRLPHVALFSTELLRDHFAQQKLGIFAQGAPGERDALVFRNAITPIEPALEFREGLAPRRLLMYARPDQTESRNMFELGLLALMRAVEQGTFAGRWTFTGVGASAAGGESIPLGGGAQLDLVGRQPIGQYRGMLRSHDLGISLMHTPHPSLVPLEMAAAGMPTVTTTFGVKTAERLQAISANLVPADPTIDGVADALARAAGRVDDLPARAAGARFDWSRTAEQAFDDGLLMLIARALDGRCASP